MSMCKIRAFEFFSEYVWNLMQERVARQKFKIHTIRRLDYYILPMLAFLVKLRVYNLISYKQSPGSKTFQREHYIPSVLFGHVYLEDEMRITMCKSDRQDDSALVYNVIRFKRIVYKNFVIIQILCNETLKTQGERRYHDRRVKTVRIY